MPVVTRYQDTVAPFQVRSFLWENILHYPMIKNIDVLVDGEFVAEQKDVKLLWKGSKNQRVIDVQKTLLQPDPAVPVLHSPDYA